MRINVGSKNNVKINAVMEVIQNYGLLAKAEVTGFEVDSGVYKQPLSAKETIKGAMNRAKNAFSNCNYSFGLEDGLIEVPETKTNYMNICACAIYDGYDYSIGLSSAFEYPPVITSLVVNEGLDINQAFYKNKLTTDPRIGSGGGAISVLTSGRLPRKEYAKQAIIMALIPIENRELYMPELLNFSVNSRTTKMLVIDAQNDVCDDNSAYANSISTSGEKRDVSPIQEAVKMGIIPFLGKTRKHKLPIGFVQSIYKSGQYSYSGISDKWLTIDYGLQIPGWRIKIYRDMPAEGEPIFKKDTQETFTYNRKENGLSKWLEGTETVLVAGFTTDGCVKKAVYALLEKGYKPIVLKDCTATSGHKIRTAHRETLNEFMANRTVQVVNSRRINFLKD